jgi:hypothetical protein
VFSFVPDPTDEITPAANTTLLVVWAVGVRKR